jgi:multidrug efflux pump subunit AcrB
MRADPATTLVNDNWNNPIKALQIDIDQDKARALGVSSEAIARSLQSLLSGLAVGQFRENDSLITLVLRAPEGEREQLSELLEVPVISQSGRAIALNQLVRASLSFEPGIRWREHRQAAITVQSELRGTIQAPTVTARIEPKLAALREKLPPGYLIKTGGATEEAALAQHSINAILPAMLLVVFTLLMWQLRSFSRATMVFLTAPLGLIGAVPLLLLLRAPFGFVAMLGLIALAGMIMRNSVILIAQIEAEIAAGRTPWEAVIESAVRRFRPIMLTAAASILAMIPLTRSIFWGPMAVTIMGGLLVATVLTVLFLPALYAGWFRLREAKMGEAPDGGSGA